MYVQFTVSTVDTSSTDYRIASRVVNTPHDQRRYQDLTRVHLADTNSSDPTGRNRNMSGLINKNINKNKLTKQIDPNYSARKLLGPTPEDLSILHVPNPLVTVNFKIDGGSGGNNSVGEGPSSRGGAGKNLSRNKDFDLFSFTVSVH